MNDEPQLRAEWLETDGLGGFSSGTVCGRRTRRYHALLLVATTPPTGRVVLVNGFEAWVETPARRFELSSQHYLPNVVHPHGDQFIESFTHEPWPRWVYRLPNGTRIEQEWFLPHEQATLAMRWRILEGDREATLRVRPLLSGRDCHGLHFENACFNFRAAVEREQISFTPYPGLPAVVLYTNASYAHDPSWYRDFYYAEEAERGLECSEDLASPGVLSWSLGAGEAVLMLGTSTAKSNAGATEQFESYYQAEQTRRAAWGSRLERAADQYLVRRDAGYTILAGYPWFTDWGRDTFIALRGLCLATGRLDVARDILLTWSGTVSQGMLPNRFPETGEAPEFNSVDASLWFVVAAYEWLEAMREARRSVPQPTLAALRGAINAILAGYARGTRFGIRLESDGLLAAGVPGAQLTWMDAKVGDWVVTPRMGKPVEVQALWLNALAIASAWDTQWRAPLAEGKTAFGQRFWNAPRGCLYDVIDVNHMPGAVDAALRPNQIFAVGGLPFTLLSKEKATSVVRVVEQSLLTPWGLRSLAASEPGYSPHYEGGVKERDAAYHMGTVWPWLLGPFVEAHVRVHGNHAAARRVARERFVAPLLAALATEEGSFQLWEIADAEPPHTRRGCPFQAWSVGELLRLERVVLAEPKQENKLTGLGRSLVK